MLAMLTVVASVGRTRSAFARRAAPDPWPPALLDALRWDLVNSRSLESAPNQIRLRGFASLDPGNLSPTHRPVEILYTVRTVAARSWLVRRQTPLEENARDAPWTTLFSPDVAAVSLVPLVKPKPAEAGDEKNATIPDELTLTLRSTDPKRPPLTRILVVR